MTDATSMSFFDGFMILKSVMDGSIARWLVVLAQSHPAYVIHRETGCHETFYDQYENMRLLLTPAVWIADPADRQRPLFF